MPLMRIDVPEGTETEKKYTAIPVKALIIKNLGVRKPSTLLDIERLDAVIRMVIQI